jgi:hypothetical protein
MYTTIQIKQYKKWSYLIPTITLEKLFNLTNFLPITASITERIFCVKNNVKMRPKCNYCSNLVPFIPPPRWVYGKFCSKSCCYNYKHDHKRPQKTYYINKNNIYDIVKEITNMVHPKAWSPYANKFIRNYMELIIKNTSFLPSSAKVSERFYCILNHVNKIPTCLNCGNNVSYISSLRGYRKFCSSQKCCMCKITVEKMKFNCFKKYGTYSTNELKAVKDKKIKTCLKHFGVPHSTMSNSMKSKSKKTCLKKYGVDNPTKLKYFVRKALETRINNHGDLYCPNIGKNEKQLLDKQEIIDNCKILRNQRVGLYYVDGYSPENNTVYEVYEKHHYKPNKIKYDIKRQTYIQERLKCKFIIIKDI